MVHQVRLRPARAADLEPIVRLITADDGRATADAVEDSSADNAEHWARALRPRLAPRSTHLFVVAADSTTDDVIGCSELGMVPPPAGYADGEDVAYIGNVFVSACARREGIGRRMVEFACKWARSQWSKEDVFTRVERGNDAARALYADVGFVDFRAPPAVDPDSMWAAVISTPGPGPAEQDDDEGDGVGTDAAAKLLLVRRGGTRGQ